MVYEKYTVQTTTEAEDVVTSTLYDLGIEGVEVVDKIPLTEEEKAGMFVDILPDAPEDDGVAYLSFYLDADQDNEALLADVRSALKEISSYMDAGPLTITSSKTKDEDYLNNWKQYFHRFYVDDILITPSWESVEEEDPEKMVIHIDPGAAFGTGMHETTQLCIRELRKYVTPESSVLDVGTGSGILSIMAYKFGAAYAMGTDLDVCAIDAVKDNMEANGLADKNFELLIGNIIDDPAIQDAAGYERYDIVCANILAEVLLQLTPVIARHMKPNGVYITSGIIDDKEEVVVQSLKEAGFEILSIHHQGEWVGISARKQDR